MEIVNSKIFFDHLHKKYAIDDIREIYPPTVGKSNIFYEGNHSLTNKKVFIKYDRHSCGSITREVEILQLTALKNSSYFPKVIAYEDTTFTFIIFEFIEGIMLSKMLSDSKSKDKLLLNNTAKQKILLQLIDILEILDNEGIIHRDIHPKNIMVTQNQFTHINRLVLIDFSFAVGINRFPELPYLIDSKRLKFLGTAAYRPDLYKWDNQYSIEQIAKQVEKNCNKKFPELWKKIISYREKLVYTHQNL